MFVLVVAKEPVPGRVKTRLCPPCEPAEAAALAEAALADTMAAVSACGADDVVIALDGATGPWVPEDAIVVPQVDGPFDRRLAAAWSAASERTTGPGVQIGMDTPQVGADALDDALGELDVADTAVLGMATDGGWWAIGLHPDLAPFDRVFHDIPMSTERTGAEQHRRLESLGLTVVDLPELLDVDEIEDAAAVAAAAPHTRFARAFREIAPSSTTPATAG